MPEQPLKVCLEVTDQRSGQYTLTFDSSVVGHPTASCYILARRVRAVW